MINICIFGAGRIGTIHAMSAAQHPEVTIRYVVDAFDEAAQKLASKYEATVTDVDTALADPEVHGVIIASSTDTHADLIEKSAQAGKAIFCEKPVDLSLDRVAQCAELVKRQGVVCAVGFNRRFDDQFRQLKQAIEQQRIGKLEMLTITSRDPSPPPIDYIKVSGGLFKDMMIHDFDMARWLLGEEPVEISATASCQVDPAIAAAGDVDTALVTLKTASGKLCQISNSRRAAYGYDQRIEAFGSLGLVQAQNVPENQLQFSLEQGNTSAKPVYFFLERYQQAYRDELQNFIECIEGKAEPLANVSDGLQAIVLAEAAQEAYRSGQSIQLK